MSDGARSGSKIIDPATGEPPVNPETGKRLVGIALNQWKMKRRIAELESQLESTQGGKPVPGPAPAPSPIADSGYDKDADPIGWMADLDEIYFVSMETYLPSNLIPVPPGTKIGEVPEKLRYYDLRTWSNMPFRIVGRNHEETENLKIQMDKHFHHRVTRHYAERVFESRWSEMPEKACIAVEDFKSHDHQYNPKGDKRPASGDPLVEYMRWILQRTAGKTWLDYAYHADHIEFTNPNPYGKGRERFTPDPTTLKTATPDGDLQVQWIRNEPRGG